MIRSSQFASVERMIGGLTMALGLGAMIPRPGLGLYALLESEGVRFFWSASMINFGFLLIACSYLPMPRLRVVMHLVACILWGGLLYKFTTVGLWGAALQACVVITFALSSAYRLRLYDQSKENNNAPR